MMNNMRIGWLADKQDGIVGGAELSTMALRRAAPDGIEIVLMQPGRVAYADAYIVSNCKTYDMNIVKHLQHKPVIKVVRDLWIAGDPFLRQWLLANSDLCVFTSRFHRENFTFKVDSPVAFCPPPVDLERFKRPQTNLASRSGVIWLGQMTNPHKGVAEAVAWARENQTRVDFYGDGWCNQHISGRWAKYLGWADYDKVPTLLASYEKFLFLPRWPEPCGRTVIEAWAAGCELIVNDKVGAMEWIVQEPNELTNAENRFWRIVGDALNAVPAA